MRKIAALSLAALLLFSGQGYAESTNIIRLNAPISQVAATSKWIPADPIVSSWVDTADAPSCTLWTPDPAGIANGTAFLQISTDCQQKQEHTVQGREKNSKTGVLRNVGVPTVESQFTTVVVSRQAVGTYVNPGVWLATNPFVSEWLSVGSPSGCTNWSPAPSTIASGLSFQQTATDCSQVQERTVQAREKNSVSLAYRDVGSPETQTQTINSTSVRDAIGTSTVKTAVWILKPGISGTFVGYSSPGGFGSILTTAPGYGLKFSYFGGGGWIWVSVTGYNNQINIPSIKVELLDASNTVTRTLSDTSFQLQTYVMGIRYTADDLTAAKAANTMRLTLQLKQ